VPTRKQTERSNPEVPKNCAGGRLVYRGEERKHGKTRSGKEDVDEKTHRKTARNLRKKKKRGIRPKPTAVYRAPTLKRGDRCTV